MGIIKASKKIILQQNELTWNVPCLIKWECSICSHFTIQTLGKQGKKGG